jgi:hypothetical protein
MEPECKDRIKLIHDEVKELRAEVHELSANSLKLLERHETDLTWIKGSVKILVTALIGGLVSLVVWVIRAGGLG